MTQHFLSGEPPIALILRRSARARRISLRVSRLDGKVTLTLPKQVSEREALDFARSKEDWLRRNLANRPEDVLVAHGSEVPFQGDMLPVLSGQGRSVSMTDEGFQVPGNAARVGVRLQSFLKEEARRRLVAASDHYSDRLGRQYTKFTLRDTRSRWGSCTSEGGLMYSWRLIMAPEEVLNYVAAHEVAHLAQMNHSPKFWAIVEKLYGPHQAERRWLRTHGEKLHRYRFEG